MNSQKLTIEKGIQLWMVIIEGKPKDTAACFRKVAELLDAVPSLFIDLFTVDTIHGVYNQESYFAVRLYFRGRPRPELKDILEKLKADS